MNQQIGQSREKSSRKIEWKTERIEKSNKEEEGKIH